MSYFVQLFKQKTFGLWKKNKTELGVKQRGELRTKEHQEKRMEGKGRTLRFQAPLTPRAKHQPAEKCHRQLTNHSHMRSMVGHKHEGRELKGGWCTHTFHSLSPFRFTNLCWVFSKSLPVGTQWPAGFD